MRISLLGWTSDGMRCPDVKVDLADGMEPSAVSLIQMPNGTGKTTTLSLLEAAMNGSATNWSETEVRDFRRPGSPTEKGVFVVRLAVDGKPLTFELTLDFGRGTAVYRTTNPGSGGVQPNWAPLPSVRRFLKPEFLNLFIFDGEFAGKLFDQRQLEAEYAIEALCQLYVLDDVAGFAEEAWNRKAKQAPVKTEAGLAKLQESHRALLKRKAEVARYRENAQAGANKLALEIEELDRRIKAKLSGGAQTRERFDAAQETLASAANKLTRVSGDAMQALRMPIALHTAFGRELVQLKEGLDKLRLPENSSAQFFQELLEEVDCICGREMTEGAREEIRARSERYLDAADAGTINALKADIEGVGEIEGEGSPNAMFAALVAELATARKEQRLATQEVDTLKKQLKDAGETDIDAWEAEQVLAMEKHEGCKKLLEDIDAEGDELDEDEVDVETWSTASLERQIKAIGNRIAKLTDTLTVRRQTELIVRILKRTGELARAEIKRELIDACNETIAKVLVNDPLRIAGIDRSLRLSGQSGASVGQTLSVGYVFLMTVLNRGNNDLPLVVDSPANPIDAGVRRRIGTLIPKLTKQFVGFTINTEREGFVPALQAASSDVRYLTMFRRTPGTLPLMAQVPADRATVTESSVLVHDQAFFEGFDIEEEV
jgi:DNA sulfur modification protein DndD